jgi:hypothetical protein
MSNLKILSSLCFRSGLYPPCQTRLFPISCSPPHSASFRVSLWFPIYLFSRSYLDREPQIHSSKMLSQISTDSNCSYKRWCSIKVNLSVSEFSGCFSFARKSRISSFERQQVLVVTRSMDVRVVTRHWAYHADRQWGTARWNYDKPQRHVSRCATWKSIFLRLFF